MLAGMKSHVEHEAHFISKLQMVKKLVFHNDFVCFTSPSVTKTRQMLCIQRHCFQGCLLKCLGITTSEH